MRVDFCVYGIDLGPRSQAPAGPVSMPSNYGCIFKVHQCESNINPRAACAKFTLQEKYVKLVVTSLRPKPTHD
jgi:hypothetical protein